MVLEEPLLLVLLAFGCWCLLICFLALRGYIKLWMTFQVLYVAAPFSLMVYEFVTNESGDKASIGALGLLILALVTGSLLFVVSLLLLKKAAFRSEREREKGCNL